MEESAYIISIAAGTFYLIAGVRLTRLSRSTGERPELLLGVYFALSGLYYLAYNLPSILGIDSWAAPIEIAIEWIYVVGVLPYLFFIRSVFRPDEAWAGRVVLVASVLLLVGIVMQTAGGRMDLGFDNPWFLTEWVGYTTPCVWMCWEATRCRRSAGKRARIGACPPEVVNRYLLLALFGGFQVLACLADLYWAHDMQVSKSISMVSDALLGGTEFASVAVLWLAFFPPTFYTNWITRRAVILPAPVDG
jgi:hypothetical protein